MTLVNAHFLPHTPKLPRMALKTKITASAPSFGRSEIAKTVKQRHSSMFLTLDVSIRLCFSGFNQNAFIANMAILRRALADADYRGSPVLVALEDSTIVVGLRKNTIESFEKAVSKVVTSFSIAISQLAFEIQPDSNAFEKVHCQHCSHLQFAGPSLKSWIASPP